MSAVASSSGSGGNPPGGNPNRNEDKANNNSTNNSDNNNSGGEQNSTSNIENSNQNNPSQSPGTPCQLPGVIYHETESGMLVVNVQWRGKTYIGTLLDTTKYAWAPPRLTDGDSENDQRKNSKRRYTNTRSMIPGTTQSTCIGRPTRRSQAAARNAQSLDYSGKNTRGNKSKAKNKTKKETKKEEAERKAAEEEAKRREEEENNSKSKKTSHLEDDDAMRDSSDGSEQVAKKSGRSSKKTGHGRSGTPTKNNDEDYNPKGSSKRYKQRSETH